jgi:uncharacterized membrane protein YfcA
MVHNAAFLNGIHRMPILLLAGLFFLTAIAYSLVGFGGGSTYNALLVLSGADYRSIPAIALSCNILVVSSAVLFHLRAGRLSFSKLLPYIVLSIPMAWLGGLLVVPEQIFIGLLGVSLLFAAIQMLFSPRVHEGVQNPGGISLWLKAVPVGGLIGFLAGITGIGGGIFLAPVIYLFRLASARSVAGITSAFILVNSMAGLAGQMMKVDEHSPLPALLDAWPLFIAVIIGGQIGSHFGTHKLSEIWVKRLTAVLILYVAVRLLLQWTELTFD